MLLMNTRKLLLIFLFFIPSTILAQLNLSVHGYLNQAYAFTDGKSIFGITKDGTTDYRHLALQFRNDVDESNVFIIQLSHRREGNSPEMQFHDDVELDWAYFEHRFSENFSIKIGKIQLPLGIYSEIRDVGVLLPFYQIPYMPYGESSYMSETIDGFSFKHTLPLSDNSSIESDLFVGQWRWIEWEIIDFAGRVPVSSIMQLSMNSLTMASFVPTTMTFFSMSVPSKSSSLSSIPVSSNSDIN